MKKEHLHIVASNLTAAYCNTYLANEDYKDFRELEYPNDVHDDKEVDKRVKNLIYLYLKIYDNLCKTELELPKSE